VTRAQAPGRDDVIAIVAAYRNRPPDSIPEQLDSLGVAWLVHEAERRFGVELDLDDELLARMSTVTGAVEVLCAARQRAPRADG
jgi:hypothetical protein